MQQHQQPGCLLPPLLALGVGALPVEGMVPERSGGAMADEEAV